MIQRIQSLWLLLAAAFGFLSFKLPFFEATQQNADLTAGNARYLNAGSSTFILISTVLSMLLAVVTVFFYKKRKLQLRLSIGGIVLSVITILFYFIAMKKTGGSVPSLTSLIVFAVPVCFLMAARGIWKDESLVKSLDRLR